MDELLRRWSGRRKNGSYLSAMQTQTLSALASLINPVNDSGDEADARRSLLVFKASCNTVPINVDTCYMAYDIQ
jgi:hypothetical protein